jgi:hypothetical protein
MQSWSVAFCSKSPRLIRLPILSKIYRCWTVYGRSWRVVCLPITFWFGSLTSAVLYIYYDILFMATGESFHQVLIKDVDTQIAFYSSNIATNVFSTCMTIRSVLFFDLTEFATGAIIYRILGVANASGNRPKRLHNVARILVESGILYTSAAIFNLIGVTLYNLYLNTSGGGAVAVAVSYVAFVIVCHPRLFLVTHDLRFRTTLWLVSRSTPF